MRPPAPFVEGANGAYWTPSTFSDAGKGDAAALTMRVAPGYDERYISLWLNMPNPGSAKSGYELRWAEDGAKSGKFDATLSKWSSGSKTVLAQQENVPITTGMTVVIADTGGTVSAWTSSGESFTELLSASDSTYAEGYAAMVAAGNASHSDDFKAGDLYGEAIEVEDVEVLDDLERQEIPLATSDWTKTNWAEEIGGAWCCSTYRGYGATAIAGAYWNQATFDDNGSDLVAGTVGSGSEPSAQYTALWLNMPSPGSTRSGYEARFEGTNNSETAYNVQLAKWVSGMRTVLTSTSGFTLNVGDTMALTDNGSEVNLKTGTSSFTTVLSATDTTYSGGYAGLEVKGGAATVYDFRAGEGSSGSLPQTNIAAGATGHVTPDIAFWLESTPGGASFECKLDTGSWGSCVSPDEHEGLSTGAHTFETRAKSGSLVDPTPTEADFEVSSPSEAAAKTWVRDDFDRYETPISSGKWAKTAWVDIIGSASENLGYTNGGEPYEEEEIAGAYLKNATYKDTAGANIVAATYSYPEAPLEGSYLSLWLEMPSPGSAKSGYEARLSSPTSSLDDFKVELSKWVSGTRTVLATTTGYTMEPGDTVLLSDSGGILSVWTGTGSLDSAASAADSEYSSGRSGIEIKNSTAVDFKAGNMDFTPPVTLLTGPYFGDPLPVRFFPASSETKSHVECSIDGEPYVECVSQEEYEQRGGWGLAEYAELDEGPHEFRARAIDQVGNADPTPESRTFDIAIPPETTITSPTPSYTCPMTTRRSNSPPTNRRSHIQVFARRRQPPDRRNAPAPYALPEKLEEGWHTFVVAAEDEWGNLDLETGRDQPSNQAIYPTGRRRLRQQADFADRGERKRAITSPCRLTGVQST